MFPYSVCFTAVLVFGTFSSVRSVTVDSEGGYKNLVVSLSSLGTQTSDALLINLQTVLNRSSQFLHTLTDKRLHFREIYFLLPVSWKNDNWWNSEEREIEPVFVREDEADVKVVDVAQLYHDRPYVLQHGGCGEKGRFIYYPTNILDATSGSASVEHLARDFVYAWNRYRYGLFPEHGFPDDPLYPDYYTPVGKKEKADMTHNSCSHPRIESAGRSSTGELCDPKTSPQTGLPEKDDCRLEPSPESDGKVNTSFMALPDLKSVNHFCDSETHEFQKPSKHNVLCKSENAWTIFSKSPDFSSKQFPDADTKVKIKYVFEEEENVEISFIYALGSEYREKERMENVKGLLLRHITERIPGNANLKMLRYPRRDGESNLSVDTYKLPDEMDLIKQRLVVEAASNVTSGNLQEVMQHFLDHANPTPGSTVVLLSHGDVSIRSLTSISTKLVEERIRVNLILYPVYRTGFQDAMPKMEKMVHATGGHVWTVQDSYPKDSAGGVLTQLALDQALADTLRGHVWSSKFETRIAREVVHRNVFLVGQEIKLPFSFQEGNVEYLSVNIYGTNIQNFLNIEVKIQMEDSETTLKPDIHTHQERPHRFSSQLSYKEQTLSSGTLKFKLLKQPAYLIVADISVKYLSLDKEVTLDAWFGDNTDVRSEGSFLIYAYLAMNGQPVRRANVTAVILTPNGIYRTVPLMDNGIGDPDVTKDDGVYSRYYTDFPTIGSYSVLITANDNQSQAQVIYASTNTRGAFKCCGSVFPASGMREVKFNKEFQLGSVYRIGRNANPDYVPPSRICDLRVSNFDYESRTFELSWTAPGNDYDHGAAKEYILKSFNYFEHALKSFESEGESVLESEELFEGDPIKPGKYGTEQNIKIKMNSRSGIYAYYAIRAADDKNKSPISNIVTVYMPAYRPVGKAIGLYVGLAIAFAALVLLSIIIISSVVCWRKKKNKGDRNTDFNETDVAARRSDTPSSLSQEMSVIRQSCSVPVPVTTLERNIDVSNLQQRGSRASVNSQDNSDRFVYIPARSAPPVPAHRGNNLMRRNIYATSSEQLNEEENEDNHRDINAGFSERNYQEYDDHDRNRNAGTPERNYHEYDDNDGDVNPGTPERYYHLFDDNDRDINEGLPEQHDHRNDNNRLNSISSDYGTEGSTKPSHYSSEKTTPKQSAHDLLRSYSECSTDNPIYDSRENLPSRPVIISNHSSPNPSVHSDNWMKNTTIV